MVFHPFGNHLHVQAFGQTHDGLHDGDVGWVGVHVHHKAAVDFEQISAYVLQVRKRGVARAKVIQRHAGAHAAHLVHKLAGVFDVLQGHAFGDFEAQHAQQRMVGVEQRIGRFQKTLVVERCTAEVDTGEPRLHQRVLVRPEPGQGGAQNPKVYFPHAAAGLRGGQQARGRHRRARGPVHAQQDFKVQRGLGRIERQQGLHLQVKARKRRVARQLRNQGEFGLVLQISRRVLLVNHQPIALRLLGLLAGALCGRQRVFDGHVFIHFDHANGPAHIKGACRQVVGLAADGLNQSFAHVRGHGHGRVRKHEHKLITAHAPKPHARGQQGSHAHAHLLQHRVAHAVAKHVVDELETVQVQVGQ